MLPEGTLLGELEIEEVFVYFDFPRLFSCKNEKGQIYLALSVEETDEITKWLYVSLSNPRLEKIRWGEISLREAFQNSDGGNAYIVTVPASKFNQSFSDEISSESIPENWLPKIGKKLESLRRRFGQRATTTGVIIGNANLGIADNIVTPYSAVDPSKNNQLGLQYFNGLLGIYGFKGSENLGIKDSVNMASIETQGIKENISINGVAKLYVPPLHKIILERV